MFPVNHQFLRLARQAAGLTQAQLAAAVGTTTGKIREWERGTCLPGPDFLRLLGNALDVDTDALTRASPGLEALRVAAGLSVAEAALAAGTSVTRYRQLERGWLCDRPDPSIIAGLIQALGAPTHSVLAAIDEDRARVRSATRPVTARRRG